MPKKGQDETFAIERKWGHRPKVILKICVHLRCFILYDCVEIETTDYSYLPTNFASNWRIDSALNWNQFDRVL